MRQPIIFLSYSHKDERDKDRLVTQLKVLEAAGRVDLWNDDRVRVGSDWKSEIDKAMAVAKVAILLVTANYLTSNFILDVEVPELLERHRKAGLSIFPVVGRECPWEEVSWLAKMKVRPKNGRPVWRSAGRYADKELANIAREVASITKKPDGPPILNSHLILPTIRGAFHRTVQEALEPVDAELRKLKLSREPIALSAIDRMIHMTISYGAPLYNQGAIKECAEIYLHTVKGLVSLMEESDYGAVVRTIQGLTSPKVSAGQRLAKRLNAKRNLGVEVTHSELKQVSSVSIVTGYNADKLAWNIRHSFDQILFVARGIKSLDTMMRSFGLSEEPLCYLISRIVESAVSQGDLIYEEGLARNKNWIKGCAAIYLYTAETILSVLPRIGPPKDKPSREMVRILEVKLSRVLSFGQFITNDNAYEVAWGIRQAFARTLKTEA